MSTHEDLFTLGPLNGHTDAIMWTGYSPDETMIATVAWDKGMRIWDAKTGQEK
jgi:WD40 repeat protein